MNGRIGFNKISHEIVQPTRGDYYLQRMSVLIRKRMTAKVRGIVQRARDALLGGPNGTFD